MLRRNIGRSGPQHLFHEARCQQPAYQRLPRLIGMNTAAGEQ